MSHHRRPRFTFPALLLRNALGRFTSYRRPLPPKIAQRTTKRSVTLPTFAQLALF